MNKVINSALLFNLSFYIFSFILVFIDKEALFTISGIRARLKKQQRKMMAFNNFVKPAILYFNGHYDH